MPRIPFLLAALLVLASDAAAQDASRYRNYLLHSSPEAVTAASGGRALDSRVLHVRPSRIQEMNWRAPYTVVDGAAADPVREIVFSFVDEQLYQLVVRYDQDRTAGLSNRDIVDSLSATYGIPLPAVPGARGGAPINWIALARWEDPQSSLSLLRDAYSPVFQLVMTSKSLAPRARTAALESVRLDAVDAPRLALEQRQKDAADATAARDDARRTNKEAFTP